MMAGALALIGAVITLRSVANACMRNSTRPHIHATNR